MKQVGIAELKAQLSKHLRDVRRGQSITVLDHDTPVATINPVSHDGFMLRAPATRGSLKNLKLPPPLKTRVDIDELLAEERRDRF